MKHLFIMKTRNIVISALTLLLCTMGVQSLYARQYEAGERLYINMRAANVISAEGLSGGWYATTSNHNRAYFFRDGSSDNWWSGEVKKYKDDIYYVEVPEGNWNRVILTRHSNDGYGWGNVWTQTGNIVLDDEKNYIQNFYYDNYGTKNGAYWEIIAPAPTGNPAGWTIACDDEQICSSAAGTSYILAPKNYDYTNSKCHAWFKYNSSTGNWDRFANGNNWEFRSSEGYQDETVTLGAAGSDTYYFYQANKPSACRLVRIRLNQNCEAGAPGACAITSFSGVASDANVTDKTCSIDGLVAFDDKLNAGTLRIWCPDIDTVEIANDAITTIPVKFKLTGFDASSTRDYTLYAEFLEGTGCGKTCVVHVTPPAVGVTEHGWITRFTQETYTLTPDNQSSTYFLWTNNYNDEEITSAPRNHTFTAPTEQVDITYTFLATNMPEIGEPNLLGESGNFEQDESFFSDYAYWGHDLSNFYTGENKGKSGGYARSKNTHTFSSTYNEVTPHEGNYLGLFDSKTGSEQAAWQVADIPVQAGVSYLFSFWVANINNYGEMNNGAQLQFQISYDGGSSFVALGGLSAIDLSDYKDNRWHGVSAIETPATTCNAVLRLINLNTTSINRGNDFALDDIRFEAITSRSSNVAGYETFPVHVLKCEIDDANFDQKQAGSCGATSAVVDYTIDFKNPRGNLFIYEGTEKLAEIPNSSLAGKTTYSGTIADRPLDGAIHTYTVYFEDGTSNPGHRTDAPTTYKDTAHVTPAISVTSTSWNSPACDVKTCTLTAVLSYTNQNGTLSANVDGGTPITPSYIVENDTLKTITLVIPGVVADGKTGHKLNVSFSGSHGCSISNYAITTAAPYGPQITSTVAEIQDYTCDDVKYRVKITVNFSNGQGKNLTITDGTAINTKVLTPAADATSANWTFEMPWEEPVASHTFKSYFEGKESCKDLDAHKATFTSPVQRKLTVDKVEVVQPACDKDKYQISVKYSYQAFAGTTITYKIGSTTIGTETLATPTGTITRTITSDALACDGIDHEFSFASDDAAHDCEYSTTLTAPKANILKTFSVAPIQPDCDVEEYNLRATWTVTKPAGGSYDVLMIKVGDATPYEIDIDASNATDGSYDILDKTYTIGDAHPTIKAYMKERDSETCYKSGTYSDPTTPTMTIGDAVPQNFVCNDPTYDIVFPVTYTYQRGDLIAWIDAASHAAAADGQKTTLVDDAKCIDEGDTYKENQTGERTTYIKFTGLSLTGEHKIYVECTGDHSCHRTKAAGYSGKSFTAPLLPKAELVTPITMPSVASCDQQTFDLTVSVKFTNEDGDLQVKVDDGAWKTFYTPSESAGEGKYIKNSAEQTKTVKLTGLPADGGITHKIYYRFNKDGYCGYDTPLESDNLTFPQSPTIISTSVSTTPTAVDCDATSYARTVTVNYKNGKGKKIVIEDEEGNKLYTSSTALTTSDGSISPSITLPYIDGASHYVIAYFEGYDCKSEPAHKGTYTAPVQPTISEVIVSTVGETKCSPYNYTISGTVTYSNADLPKKLIVAYGALKDEITLSSASATVDFTISDMTATGSALTVDAYFESTPDACKLESNPFASPTAPSAVIKNVVQSTPGCDDLKYNLSFDVDYIYQHGDLTVHVDTYGDTVISIPAANRKKAEKLTAHVTYTAKIPADGNTHTLYISFAGENSCSRNQSLTAVLSPVITDLDVDVPTTPIDCDASSYPASVTVKTQYAVGKTFIIMYKDAADKDVELGTHKVLTSPEETLFTSLSFRDIGATGTRSVWAYFSDRDTCVKFKEYSIPPTTSIDPISITKITDKSTCDGVKYDLEGDITYSSVPAGAEPAVRFGAYNATMSAVTATSAHFKFTNVTTTGEGLHVEAYFSNKPNCYVPSATFKAPLKPDVQVINQVMADAKCNVMTTTLTFDIVYTKQPTGELKVWVNDKIGERTITYTPNDGKEKPDTIHAAVSGIPATGGAYTLHVNFASGCGDRTFTTPATKFSPVITDSTAVISGESCSSNAYTVTVTFKVKNGQGKTVKVEGKGLPPQSKTAVDGANTFTFTGVPRTLGVADDDYFEIYFPDALPSCPHVVLEYAETPKPVLSSITPDAAPALDCPDETYTLTGNVGYTYINAQPYIWLDEDEEHAVAIGTAPGSYTDKSVTPATTSFSLPGIPADGQTHTLHLKAAGWTAGCTQSQTFTAALQPVFGTAKAAASETYLHCGKTYSVTVTVPFVHSGGKKLYVEYTDGSTETKDVTTVAGDTEKQIKLEGLTTIDGASHSVKIWFEDFASCFTTATYKAPVLKAITNVGAITSNDVTCGATSFSITGTVTANVAGETIVITTEGGESTTITSKKDEAVSYTITGLTDAGQLTAQFDGVACSITSKKSYDAVELKPYPTFSLKDITPQCYPASSYTIGYDHTDAATIKYTVNGGEEVSVAVNAAKEFTITTTGWAAGDYKVEAYAESAAGCKSATPYPTRTLTINKKPSLELAAIADVCEGTSGVSTAVTLKDGAAKYDYDVFKNGVLMSDQHKSGQTAASISLSTTTWEPATYKIQVTAYSSADCPSDPKEVSFVINPLPVISELTASQTICEEDDAVSYDFTIAGAETYSYSIEGTAIAETDISVPVGGSGTISFDPSALSDGDYTLQVIAKSELGCTTTRNAALKINNKPTVSLTATTNICYGDPAGLTFRYTVSADADYYEFRLWRADRSQYYGGEGAFFTQPVQQSGIIQKSFIPYGSPLSGGDYVAVMWIKNSAGCVSDSVVVPFTIYPLASAQIVAVASVCADQPQTTVVYSISNATAFRYKIEGVMTEWSDPQTPSTEDLKHFEFDISGLGAGNYTIKMQGYNEECGYSNYIFKDDFTIYPLPTLTMDAAYTTSAGVNVCYPVSQVDIPYTSTDAVKYAYELTGGGYNRKDTLPASTSGSIEVDTKDLPTGDYALSVTAVSDHECEIAEAQTTTIHINPRPTFTFKTAVAHDCYPSTTISVGYTSTYADKYSYTLTKEGAGSPVRTVNDQDADEEGVIVLNTDGLSAGTYELKVTAKSEHNCDLTAPVTKTVTIYNQPTIAITSVENHCEGSDDITVGYTAEYATDYTYEVVGTTINGHGAVTEPGSFKMDLSSLEDGNYKLRMHVTAAHSPLTCDGTTDDYDFVIWAVPEVSIATPAPIKEGVANVTVALELDKAETYDWRFMDGTTTLESGADVPASATTITLTTSALTEGTYTLFVTPKTSHCTGEEKEVHVVVNNKPTINFTDPDIVCAGTSTLNVEYSTSPDATDLYYTIEKDAITVVEEQHVDLTSTTSPLAVNISSLPYGDYTLKGHVISALESGDNTSVNFTLMAVPTIKDVSQPKEFILCDETYEATITVNIFNAAGRKIYAKYTDDGEHTAHVETSVGDETATITLTGLTHTDLSGKHEVLVYVDGFEGCAIAAKYDEPKLMTITEGFEVKPLAKKCGDDKFTLTGTVVTNCNTGKIVVEYSDSYKAEVNASTDGSNFTIADIPAGGSVTQLKAYFQGKTCGVVESAVFAEPTKPEASITYTPFVTPACDVPTFDLEFSLDYIYQEAGMLTVWVDDDHKNTYTNGTDSETDKYVALAESEKTLVGTIEGLPADGRTGQKLYFEFNGSHSCKGSVDLAQFPRTPLIIGVEIVAGTIPDLVPGESGTYSPEFTVSYKWTAGETLVLEYQKANGNWEQTTTTVSGEGTYTFSGLTFDDVAMENREVHVHFDGAEFSECVHPLPYTTPSNSSAQFVSVEQVNTSTCDHLRYDLTGFVTFVGEPVGDLIVAFADSLCVIPNADCQGKSNTNIQFEIKNVEVDIPSTGMQLITYFSEISDHKTTSDEVFNNPVIPHVEISDAAYSIPACNSTLTTLTFNLSYLKQQGDLHVGIDGVEQTYSLSETLALDNDETKQVTVTVVDRLATGKTLPLRVWFDGSNSCDKTVDVELPFGAEISAIQEPVISDEFCDADDYTVTVQFTVTNGQGKNVTATCKGKPVTQASIEGVNTIVLTNVPRNTEANVVELFFAEASNTTCAHQTVEFTQRPKPELTGLSIVVDPAAITCDAATYPLQGSISYRNLGAATLTMWLEESGESTAVPVTGTITTEGETSTLVFTSGIDVPTDNRQYILHVKAEGDNWRTGCNELTAYISAVWRPAITSVTATPDKIFAHCDDSYTVSGRIDFVRGGGKYPVIACYEGTTLLSPTISYTAQTDTYVEYTISGLTNIGASDCSVKAYFEDYTPACADVAEPSAAFTAPTEIVITSFTATAQAMNCGATDYVVEGVVTANYATDAKIAITDGTNTIQVPASASGEPYTLSGVTLSGTQHLTATFVGHICPAANSDDFVEPALPNLDATMNIDTVFSCGGKEYKVDVTVISANQHGECAVLDSIAGGVAVAKMNDSGTFTIARPAASETHFIVVRYPATGCEVVIPTPLDINPYLKPKPLISLKPIDRLCDTETELVLPFAITQGDIDEATLSLSGSAIVNAVLDINDTKDTLTYTLADKLSAGKHTVTVEARDTLGCITTAELPIEVALDGQIYSKWSDVLLIDNYNGLYTGYQWYRNDQPLGNEQILYVPEGMEGDNYYCLLTLGDGSQIYTCEYVFEDIPRSADNPREQATNNIVVLPNRVPMGGTVTVQQTADETLHLFLMSATGKRVAEYTQTQSKQLIDMPAVQGVYLLRIASGNEVHAAKIVVY